MSRLEQLQQMLSKEPNDTFLRYAVAMELRSQEQFEASLAAFSALRQQQPPHVPSFFMSGQLLAELDRIDESRAVLRDGIEIARRVGDHHAAGEMSEFLGSLGVLGE